MKLSGLGKLFQMLYDDEVDIYRTSESDNEDSTVDISYAPKPLYKNVKCRLSFSSDDIGSDSEVDMTPVRFGPKLFVKTDVDIRAGDYVVVRRYTDSRKVAHVYEGIASEPSWYATHQEIFIRVDKGA